MAIRKPKVGDTVSYRYNGGRTTDAVVLGRQESAPPAPATTTAATGGTLADSTYSYRVSAVIGGVDTPASAIRTQTTTGGGTSTVTVNWTTIAASAPYTGATAFKVYGRTGSQLLMATVNMPTTTWVDNGSVTPSGALPAADDRVRLRLVHLKQVLTAAKATAMKQLSRYYAR